MAYDPGPLPQRPESVEEDLAFRDRLSEVADEKRQALKEAGPGWREWFLFSGLKWYVGLAFLVANSWLVVGWFEAGSPALAVGSVVLAGYAEFLCFRLLWYRPPLDRPIRSDFHRNWYTPVQFGRWTPEADLVRSGALTYDGPNPREFL